MRDLDAHSWVEVWFTGIGWVPFDPTPGALAGAVAVERARRERGGADAGEVRASAAPRRRSGLGTRGTIAGGRHRRRGWIVPGADPAAGLGSAGAARRCWPASAWPPARGSRRTTRGRRSCPSCAERSCGWAGSCPASTTLLALERRLGRFAGPSVGGLRGRLRANRYDPRAPGGPSLRGAPGGAPGASRAGACSTAEGPGRDPAGRAAVTRALIQVRRRRFIET